MFASTFTESLSAARALYDTIAALVARGEWYWLLTLHPKTDAALVARYRALAEAHPRNAVYLGAERLLDMLRAGDAMLCDTSSAIDEFAVQLKPVVTFRNRRPKPFMLDVMTPDAVEPALRAALQPTAALVAALRVHADTIHPYRDGRSSERVLDATQRLLEGGYGALARKPLNLWRRWQARRDLAALLQG
jgi:CDP-glycerol glycerophosphotransferase (TagB/SpsB family)